MSHRDESYAAQLCAEHRGFAHFHGGGKTSTKAECIDGTRFYMSDGEMVGDVDGSGAVLLLILLSFFAVGVLAGVRA